SYTLTLANAGPPTAANPIFTDTPTNLTITNVSGACASFSPCIIASLASGANTVINVTATINAAGAFDNSTTVSGTETDPNPGDNTDSTNNGGTAAASADVSVVKTLTTAGPYSAGQPISYTLTVANAGPSTATNVQVTDTPTNLPLTNLSGGGCSLPFPCTIPSINSGANVVLTVTATINAAGAFDNSTTVSATEPDPNSGNNTDNSGNGGTAAASADVTVVKTLTTSGPFTAVQTPRDRPLDGAVALSDAEHRLRRERRPHRDGDDQRRRRVRQRDDRDGDGVRSEPGQQHRQQRQRRHRRHLRRCVGGQDVDDRRTVH